MAKLINKLNTLVQSSARSVFGSDPDRRKQRALPKLGKEMDREIATLREQVNQALDDEDRMMSGIDAMQRQIAAWDQQADEALKNGDEASARHLIRQMQRQQQRMTMLQAELEQHKLSTSDLISRVNDFEAIVAQARHKQEDTVEPSHSNFAANDIEEDDETLSSRLRKAHQRATSPPEQVARDNQEQGTMVDEQAVEDDLAQRRARLSQ